MYVLSVHPPPSHQHCWPLRTHIQTHRHTYIWMEARKYRGLYNHVHSEVTLAGVHAYIIKACTLISCLAAGLWGDLTVVPKKAAVQTPLSAGVVPTWRQTLLDSTVGWSNGRLGLAISLSHFLETYSRGGVGLAQLSKTGWLCHVLEFLRCVKQRYIYILTSATELQVTASYSGLSHNLCSNSNSCWTRTSHTPVYLKRNMWMCAMFWLMGRSYQHCFSCTKSYV